MDSSVQHTSGQNVRTGSVISVPADGERLYDPWAPISLPALEQARTFHETLTGSVETGRKLDELFQKQAVLHAGEIVHITSFEELQDLYASRGHTFRSIKELEARVLEDWTTSRCQQMLLQVARQTVPRRFPFIQVVSGTQVLNVFGVRHVSDMADLYCSPLGAELSERPNWIVEQNLMRSWIKQGKFVKDYDAFESRADVIEVPDHCMIPAHREFRVAYARFFGDMFRYFNSLRKTAFKPAPEPVEGDKTQAKNTGIEAGVESMLCDPLLNLGYPWNIDVVLRRKQGKPLRETQLRSAYLAELLRGWDAENKNLLTGVAHSLEIRLFLESDSVPERARRIAGEHCEVLNRSPEEFARLRKEIKARQHSIREAAHLSAALTPGGLGIAASLLLLL